jgi:hypothetical protein
LVQQSARPLLISRRAIKDILEEEEEYLRGLQQEQLYQEDRHVRDWETLSSRPL